MITPERQRFLEALGAEIFKNKVMPEVPDGVGVALLAFDMNNAGYLGYCSNARRKEMITALRECADKLEAGQAAQTVKERGDA